MHFGVLIGGNSAGGVVLPSRPAGRTPENRLLTKFARLADMSERFVHQQLHHVLPPDVDDERELRLQHRGVREILLGTYANIDPAGLRGRLECRNDVLILKLVRDEVL